MKHKRHAVVLPDILYAFVFLFVFFSLALAYSEENNITKLINKDSDNCGSVFLPAPGHAQGSRSTSEHWLTESSHRRREHLKTHWFCSGVLCCTSNSCETRAWFWEMKCKSGDRLQYRCINMPIKSCCRKSFSESKASSAADTLIRSRYARPTYLLSLPIFYSWHSI